MGGTFFALSFLAFTSLTTVDLLMNERTVVLREVRSRFYRPSSYLISKIALDGMLLRVIPAILYWIPFYYMAGFQYGSDYAASFLFTLIAFNCAVGAMSMCVTIGCNTAGQASFIMNFLLLFSARLHRLPRQRQQQSPPCSAGSTTSPSSSTPSRPC